MLIALFTAVAPIYVTYDLEENRKSIKEIKLKRYFINDLTDEFDSRPSEINYKITFKGKPLKNIIVLNEYIVNTGTEPVLPSDFFKPLSISVKKPWKILLIESKAKKNSNQITVKWSRLSEIKFEADPFLFNPGDKLSASIYLTTEENNYKLQKGFGLSAPKITSWNARIVDVSHIIEEKKVEKSGLTSRLQKNQWPKIWVALYGYGLAFFLLASVVFFLLFYFLFRISYHFHDIKSWKCIVPICIFFGISISTAEVLSYYLFPNFVSELLGNSIIVNFLIIFIFIASISFLLWRSKFYSVSKND